MRTESMLFCCEIQTTCSTAELGCEKEWRVRSICMEFERPLDGGAMVSSGSLSMQDSGCPWGQLGDTTNKINKQEIGDKVISKIQRIRNQTEPVHGTPSWNQAKTTLTMPADCLSKLKKSNHKVQFHPCFAGGRQIFLKEDGELEYTLEPMLLAPDNSIKAKQRNSSFCVCTVHRDETNLVVAVSTEGKDESKATYNVPLPHTKGEWHTTKPVTIALEEGGPKKISLTRANKKFGIGISLKQIKLSPLSP